MGETGVLALFWLWGGTADGGGGGPEARAGRSMFRGAASVGWAEFSVLRGAFPGRRVESSVSRGGSAVFRGGSAELPVVMGDCGGWICCFPVKKSVPRVPTGEEG
jgi:hypothetical protein